MQFPGSAISLMGWKNRREREAIGKLWSALRKEHYPGLFVCMFVAVDEGGRGGGGGGGSC